MQASMNEVEDAASQNDSLIFVLSAKVSELVEGYDHDDLVIAYIFVERASAFHAEPAL